MPHQLYLKRVTSVGQPEGAGAGKADEWLGVLVRGIRRQGDRVVRPARAHAADAAAGIGRIGSRALGPVELLRLAAPVVVCIAVFGMSVLIAP